MLARTTYTQLISKRLPYIAMWGAGLGTFFVWPSVVAGISNKAHHVPTKASNVTL